MIFFENRLDAAERLSERLMKFKDEDPIVLAVPRGAVVMGKIIAEKLNAPLDVVLVRKIGHPDNPELAVGAVSESGDVMGNEVASIYGLSDQDLKSLAKDVIELLRERRKKYTQFKSHENLKDRTVIIVDDGIATGATMEAAVKFVRHENPKRVVVATAVSSVDAAERLKRHCDEFISLGVPEDFYAVGVYFGDFPQVSDDEVSEILAASGAEKKSGNENLSVFT